MFSLIKLVFTLGLIFMILTNLIKNIDYYSYCKLTEHKEELFNKSENSKEFRDLCKDIFKDFSDHIFLQYTFNLVYEIIKPEYVFKSMSEDEAISVIERIEHTYLGSLKYNLKFFKFTNFIFYVVNLYLVFIVLPFLFFSLIFYILWTSVLKNICLMILYLVLVVEGFLNFYTNIKLNKINLITNLISYYLLTNLLNYLFRNARNIILHLRIYIKI